MEIKIAVSLHNRFIKRRNVDFTQTECYIVGANKEGVCIDAEPLAKDMSGCEFMPGISAYIMAAGMLAIIKKGLTPVGLLRISPILSKDSEWFGDSGSSIEEHPNKIFITYGSDFTVAEYVDEDSEHLERANIFIVPDPKPAAAKKKPAARKKTKKATRVTRKRPATSSRNNTKNGNKETKHRVRNVRTAHTRTRNT